MELYGSTSVVSAVSTQDAVDHHSHPSCQHPQTIPVTAPLSITEPSSNLISSTVQPTYENENQPQRHQQITNERQCSGTALRAAAHLSSDGGHPMYAAHYSHQSAMNSHHTTASLLQNEEEDKGGNDTSFPGGELLPPCHQGDMASTTRQQIHETTTTATTGSTAVTALQTTGSPSASSRHGIAYSSDVLGQDWTTTRKDSTARGHPQHTSSLKSLSPQLSRSCPSDLRQQQGQQQRQHAMYNGNALQHVGDSRSAAATTTTAALYNSTPSMGMLSNGASCQNYDFAFNPFHCIDPNPRHQLLSGGGGISHSTPSSNLIPLVPPSANFVTFRPSGRSGIAASTAYPSPIMTATGGSGGPAYSFLGGHPSFYYDYNPYMACQPPSQHQTLSGAVPLASMYSKSREQPQPHLYHSYQPLPSQHSSSTTSHLGLVNLQPPGPAASTQVSSSSASAHACELAPSPFTGNAPALPPTTTATLTSGNNNQQPPAGPLKRPRGRPRKHPLPVSQEPTHQQQGAYAAAVDPAAASMGALGVLGGSSMQDTLSAHRKQRVSYASRTLQRLEGLFQTHAASQLEQLESENTPHYEVAEEYIALGGPFTRLATAVHIQQQQNASAVSSDHDKSTESSQRKPVGDLVDSLLRRHVDDNVLIVNLNKSFLWKPLNPKIPVRDVSISRYHIAALLNDSRVLVYRHKTHPLVTTRVDQWEHIEALDNSGIVAVRITSALLPDDWRDTYHRTCRPQLITRVRHDLTTAGVTLPQPNMTDPFSLSSDELKLFIQEHPEGILCSETIPPDWLPDPFVLAALDHHGVVRLAKCCGYFNYPTVIKHVDSSSTPSPVDETHDATELAEKHDATELAEKHDATELAEKHEGDAGIVAKKDEEAGLLRQGTTSCEAPNGATTGGSAEEETTLLGEAGSVRRPSGETTDMTTAVGGGGPPQPTTARLDYNLVRVRTVERQPDLMIPVKDPTGDHVTKLKAQVQDVALAELTESTLLSQIPGTTAPDVAMVLYATAEKEHSVFIRSKHLYVRFKHFPTGPAKLHCSPLGYTGVLLLANGTVWTWTAHAGGAGGDKMGAGIRQVGGSLTGRHVVDLAAIGADFLALTSDGIVHEWNNYAPYRKSHDHAAVTVPHSTVRPMIPEPIELTPTFQSDVLSSMRKQEPPFRVGHFRWICANGIPPPVTTECDSLQDDHPMQQPPSLAHLTETEPPRDPITASDAVVEDRQAPPAAVSDVVPHNNCSTLTQTSKELARDTATASTESSAVVTGDTSLGVAHVDQGGNDDTPAGEGFTEDVLERQRQAEIRARYNGSPTPSRDCIERIFVTEGVTIFLRPSSLETFTYLPNDLGTYRSGVDSRWTPRHALGHDGLTLCHAETLKRRFRSMGKPLLTNPVVVARLKLPHETSDDQLRHQLEVMASESPPPYRVLTSPTSVMVAVLRRLDPVEEAKQLVHTRVPIAVAAEDPARYLEAFTGVTCDLIAAELATRHDMRGRGNNSRSALMQWLSTEESSDSSHTTKPLATAGDSSMTDPLRLDVRQKPSAVARRPRGRVGRPRGSRAGIRAVLSTRRSSDTIISPGPVALETAAVGPTSFTPPTGGTTTAAIVTGFCQEMLLPPQQRADTTEDQDDDEDTHARRGPPAAAAAAAPFPLRPSPPPQQHHVSPSSRARSSPPRDQQSYDVRKRSRRQSAAIDDDHYYTGFADSEDSDKTWEQILQILDDDASETDEQHDGKRKKKRGKARQHHPHHRALEAGDDLPPKRVAGDTTGLPSVCSSSSSSLDPTSSTSVDPPHLLQPDIGDAVHPPEPASQKVTFTTTPSLALSKDPALSSSSVSNAQGFSTTHAAAAASPRSATTAVSTRVEFHAPSPPLASSLHPPTGGGYTTTPSESPSRSTDKQQHLAALSSGYLQGLATPLHY